MTVVIGQLHDLAGRAAERGASARAYSGEEEMIVAIEKQDSTSLEQVRTALVDWGRRRSEPAESA